MVTYNKPPFCILCLWMGLSTFQEFLGGKGMVFYVLCFHKMSLCSGQGLTHRGMWISAVIIRYWGCGTVAAQLLCMWQVLGLIPCFSNQHSIGLVFDSHWVLVYGTLSSVVEQWIAGVFWFPLNFPFSWVSWIPVKFCRCSSWVSVA